MPLAAYLQRKSARILIATLGGVLGAMALAAAGALGRIENILFDQRTRALAGIPADKKPPIEIILLDQASLDWAKAELGWGWPWPREAYAKITDYCATSGARVVAFDVLFTEPSVHGVEDDLAFGAALARTEADLLAAVPSKKILPDGGQPDARWFFSPVDGLYPPAMDLSVEGLALDAISSNSLAVVANGFPDEDGVFRHALPWARIGGLPVLSLGMGACFLELRNEELLMIRDPKPHGTLQAISFPFRTGEPVKLRHHGSVEAYQPLSAAAVLQSALQVEARETPSIPPETFKEQYVFFAFSAPGLMDLRPTPLSPKEPGVMSHVTLFHNLLLDDWMRAPRSGAVPVALMLCAAASATLMTLARKVSLGLAAMLLLAALPILLAYPLHERSIDLPAARLALAAILASVTALSLNYATEGRQKAFLKAAFAHYLSPEVIERLIASPDQLRLGGERKELTMFFSDLEGFSSFSEKLSPEKLTSVLNAFLTEMTEIVLAEGGTLDKYIGDAIVAFWNAPLPQPDHALRAVRAALACQARIREKQEEWFRDYGVRLRMRIGINTGEVVVGNMGSDRRFDYTMLGDAANLASRLEGANKVFHTYLLISESTRAALGDDVPCRELGGLKVVGREAALRVHEPVTARTPAHAEHERGLALLRAGDLAAAAEVFAGLPDDPTAHATLRECRRHLESGISWDGIWRPSGK